MRTSTENKRDYHEIEVDNVDIQRRDVSGIQSLQPNKGNKKRKRKSSSQKAEWRSAKTSAV